MLPRLRDVSLKNPSQIDPGEFPGEKKLGPKRRIRKQASEYALHYPAVNLPMALPCGNFVQSNSAWLQRFAVPRRAALLVRISTDRYGEVRRIGAPYALHYPAVNLRLSHTGLRHSKPSGYHMTHPSSSYKTYKSYKSYASVTPSQTAHPRCHQTSKALPCGNFWLSNSAWLQRFAVPRRAALLVRISTDRYGELVRRMRRITLR